MWYLPSALLLVSSISTPEHAALPDVKDGVAHRQLVLVDGHVPGAERGRLLRLPEAAVVQPVEDLRLVPGEPVRGGPRRAQDVEILISGDVIDAVPLELLGVVVVGRGASGGTAEIERDRSRDRKAELDGRVDGGVNGGRPAPAIETPVMWKSVYRGNPSLAELVCR